MTFDEQIKEALDKNSEWKGSPDVLWAKISPKLKKKKAWWQGQTLWLGTAVAATLFLAIMIQTQLAPLPPEPPEPAAFRMQPMAKFMVLEEPLQAQPGETLELSLDVYAVDETEPVITPLLRIWRQAPDQEDVLDSEIMVKPQDFLLSHLMTIQVPNKAGSYRLEIEGSFWNAGQLYAIYAEQKIIVQAEKGR